MSYWPQTGITYSDTPMFDAFGRLRSSHPETLFDSKLTLDAAPHIWDEAQTSGAGTSSTYSRLRASVAMAVGASTAGTRVRQSKRWFDYQPGKSQLIYTTFVMGAAATGITRRVGYFSTNNGIFLEQTATGLSVVIRTWISGTPSDVNKVAQANWNLDRLDGSGPSGQVLDITKSQIFFIDFEWLGVGRVKCGFVINGLYVTCHQFLNANVNASVYMSSPNQPIRYEISNSGAGGAATFECICASVISEGGRAEIGYEMAASRAGFPMTTNNDSLIYPLVAVRLNGSYPGARVSVEEIQAATTTTSPFNWFILENPTITGGAFVWQSQANSAVEYSVQTGGTVTVSSLGRVLKAGVSATNELSTIPSVQMQLGSSINGTTDIWVLCVQRLSTAAETFFGAVNWHETGA